MKQLTLRCIKDGAEFDLKSGLTKAQSIELQNQNSDNSGLQAKLAMDQQFDHFVDAIVEHSKQCDGYIVVDPASYLIAD